MTHFIHSTPSWMDCKPTKFFFNIKMKKFQIHFINNYGRYKNNLPDSFMVIKCNTDRKIEVRWRQQDDYISVGIISLSHIYQLQHILDG